MLKQKNIVVLCGLLALLSCNCCNTEFDELNPQPFSSAEEYVITAIHQWLDVRIDETNWDGFSSSSASWRFATSFADLYISLDYLGNFQRKINDIKSSEQYQVDSEDRLFFVVKQALSSFVYEE